MTTTRYSLSNTFYNKSKFDSQAILEDDRFHKLEFDSDKSYKLHVARFSVNTNRIPSYIPRIEKPINSIFSDDNGTFLSGFLENPDIFDELLAQNLFPTNLEVLLEWTNDADPYATRNRRHGEIVLWHPDDNNLPKPVARSLNREYIYNNRYFYCYSEFHRLQLVANALSVCFYKMSIDLNIPYIGDVQLDTYDNIITLFIPSGFYASDYSKRFNIIVNNEFKQLFGFDFINNPSNTLSYILPHLSSDEIRIGIQDVLYRRILTTHKITSFFPYKLIIFKSGDFGVLSLKKNNSNDTNNNAEDDILTDLVLNVEDVSQFYDLTVYQPSNPIIRAVDLNPDNFRRITKIYVYLESADGYQSQLYISPESSCELFLEIQEQ
jgi:hypothetical protein